MPSKITTYSLGAAFSRESLALYRIETLNLTRPIYRLVCTGTDVVARQMFCREALTRYAETMGLPLETV